jgi:hypothetical protein
VPTNAREPGWTANADKQSASFSTEINPPPLAGGSRPLWPRALSTRVDSVHRGIRVLTQRWPRPWRSLFGPGVSRTGA